MATSAASRVFPKIRSRLPVSHCATSSSGPSKKSAPPKPPANQSKAPSITSFLTASSSTPTDTSVGPSAADATPQPRETPPPSIAPARPTSTSSSLSPPIRPSVKPQVEPEVEPGVPDVLWDERSMYYHVDYWAGMTASDMESVIGENIDPEVFRRNTPGFSGNRQSSTSGISENSQAMHKASGSSGTASTPMVGIKRKADVYEQDDAKEDDAKEDGDEHDNAEQDGAERDGAERDDGRLD